MKRKIILAVFLWLIWLWLCGAPKRFEDLTTNERIMLEMELTPIF